VALFVLILGTPAADARGQADDPVAALTLGFGRDGAGWVGLTVTNLPGGQVNEAAVSRGLVDAIPADWANVDRRRVGARWSWFLRRWPAPPEKPAARQLDLTSLLASLRGEGVTRLRLTIMVDRLGDVACNLTARPTPQRSPVLYHEELATDQPAPPLEIRYGERPTVPRLITARAGQWSLALAALALAPMLLAAWRVRRLATRAATARLGHALWRLHTHGPLATMFAWFVALGVTGGLALATGWLDGPRPQAWILRWLVLFALPPAAATLLAARLARPALDRLRTDDWVGVEALENAPWAAVLQLVATVLVGSAAVLLFSGYNTLGFTAFLVGGVAQLIADGVSERQSGKVIDQSGTELAENVHALAKMLGLRVKAVGIVASATRRTEFYGPPKVVLTPPLIEHFSRPAVDALVAQGLARTTTALGTPVTGLSMCASALFAVASGAVVMWRGDDLPAGVDWGPLTAATSLALLALSFRAMMRTANRLADHRAARLTDPGALVAALGEQERRRGEPPNRSWFEDVLLRRSCAARRAAALARHHGWSLDEIARLLAVPVGIDPSRYDVPLPHITNRPDRKVFSAIAVALMLALPLAFAHAAEASPPGVSRAAVLAAGVIGVPLLYWLMLGLILGGKNAANGRELRTQLRAEGGEPAALSGVLVAFAPDREPHNYDGTSQWDIGYLVPAGDRLVFIGRRARAAVPWAAVEISQRRWDGYGPSACIMVTWDGGAFSVWSTARPVPWGFARATAEVRARLEGWRDGAVTADSLPAAWADLPPPPPTPEGAKPFRESATVRVLVGGIATLAVLMVAAAWLTGLPFVAEWRGAGYAVAVMIVTLLAFTLPPLLLARRRRPATE
jgi:hypothetical protein